ncbi:hypothetical protein C8R48DRAFT_577905, partial [Suillus tomentosus]
TQFLTKVQGMPKQIEAALSHKIGDFLWNSHRSHPVGLDRLQRPLSEGGINLLDIKARNQTIDITWLSTYMNLSPTCPTWAFTTDIMI